MGSKSHQKISTIVIICLMFTLGLVKQTNSLSPTTTIQPSIEQSELIDKSDLDNAETKDAQKSEIIKQIRRMNDDGSYTVGYEAVDGTFKIESRDVLGNVKGTYGYVDANGEIKRVSYTANNQSSGLKSTTSQPTDQEEVVHIPRQNKTGFVAASTTRRPPSLAYLTSSPASPTRPSVVQPIPKRRILLSSSERSPYSHQFSSTRQNEYTTVTPRNNKGEPTTTVVYATSVPSFKPHINIRPTPLPTTYKTEQLTRPDKLEITDHVSKVQINSNRESSTSKPVFEAQEEKVSERKSVRGNHLRRQLADDHDEKFEAQQQVIYSQSAGDDSSHIYGGVTGTARPLFTTSSPRIPSLVLAARSRAAQLQNAINAQTTSTTEKVYAKPPRRRPEPDDDEQTTESTSENNYITQGPVPVQIPANRDVQEASEDDKRVYRRPVVAYQPRAPREFLRQSQPTSDFDYGGPRQFRLPIPQAYPPPPYPQGYQRPVYTETPRPEAEQYLRETSASGHKGAAAAATPAQFPAVDPNDPYQAQRGRQYLPYQQQRGESGYEQPSIPVPFSPNPYSPYRQPLPSQYYNNPDRPLTARDFERLLNLLVVRHQQFGRFNYNGFGGGLGGPVNPYYSGGYNPYGPSQFGYQQIPRPPLYNPYDPRYSGYNQQPVPPLYGQYSENENMYQQQQQQPQQITAPDQQIPFIGQRSIPRRKPYGQQYFGAPDNNYPIRPEYTEASQPQGEYLPSEVREELLYRMLLLAMHPNEAQGSEPEASSPEYVASSAATTTIAPNKFRKPVRSVQILGEE
ncbi:uncharacterized protein LOC119081828 [Bradysia coprophila]|uniref:uncharacterized protein LOC119081828 n=1 Tax=Bradysia coprophila TaxID=38358 RepID=UPI00187DA0C3|nr:uncharacterized protein LOC119081828 [Bradysia coprophila]